MMPDRRSDELRGRTVISGRSLQALATRLASESAQTRDSDVALELSDELGRLRVAVRLPLTIGDETLPERAESIRTSIIDGMQGFAGRSVSAVDVRFEGVHQRVERRVR